MTLREHIKSNTKNNNQQTKKQSPRSGNTTHDGTVMGNDNSSHKTSVRQSRDHRGTTVPQRDHRGRILLNKLDRLEWVNQLVLDSLKGFITGDKSNINIKWDYKRWKKHNTHNTV